jgi:hypothetical protein
MSAMSEESPLPPTSNPQDPQYYAPRQRSERIEPRLATVNERAAFERARRGDTSLPASTALSAKLENAVYESLRRPLEPQIVPEPNDTNRLGTRRTLIAIASGVGAALALASVAALLFVTVYPREQDAGRSFAAAPATAAAPARQADDKPALSQFRALVNANAGGQNFTHEQSERLLQQFVQWREKAAATTSKP